MMGVWKGDRVFEGKFRVKVLCNSSMSKIGIVHKLHIHFCKIDDGLLSKTVDLNVREGCTKFMIEIFDTFR